MNIYDVYFANTHQALCLHATDETVKEVAEKMWVEKHGVPAWRVVSIKKHIFGTASIGWFNW